MEWNFKEADPDSHDRKDASKQTVQSTSNLSPLQIFVREVLQNSLDNPLSPEEPVKISFDIQYLKGEEKKGFLDAMGWDAFKSHLKASRDEMIKVRGGTMLSDPAKLEESDTVLKLLFINDNNTKGLIGAEMPDDAEKYAGPHCFVGLCRNTGDNQKAAGTSGGTNGFGKTVLWKSSRIGTVLFYSKLSEKYESHDKRLFGHMRLESYSLGGASYRGLGFCGERVTKDGKSYTVSRYDIDADSIATKLHFRKRNDDFGTSILIVDFDDPDTDDEDENPKDTAENMIKATEEYYWPAIIDGRLEVCCTFKDKGITNTVCAQPHERPDLKSFIKAYSAIKREAEDELITVDSVEFKVPSGPSPEEPDSDAKAFVAVKKELENSSANPKLNHTALIRGAGMVVGYTKVTRALGGEDYYGVVVSGNACPINKSDCLENQRSEKLLAYSEPVTHDAWKHNSDNIKACGWKGARASVRAVVDGYINAIKNRTGHVNKSEGDAAPLLGRLLTLGQGDAGTSERDISITDIQKPFKATDEKGSKGIFGFNVEIPPKDLFAGKTKPEKWRIKCTYGFLGEGGRNGSKISSLNVPVRAVRILLDGVKIDIDSEFKKEISFEHDVTDTVQKLSIEGETDYFTGLTANTARHEVDIVCSKGYDK